MAKVIILAMICESVWQTLKMSWQKDKYLTIDNVGAIVCGLIVSFATNLDILSIVDIKTSVPYVGIILTGILISRGSNFIHDLLIKFKTTIESIDVEDKNV